MSELTDEERGILERYRRPRSAQWELRDAALLVVDVVESFVGRDVPVAQAQEDSVQACGENAWRALGPIRALLDQFRAAQRPVVYSTVSSLPPAVGTPPAPPRGGALRGDTVVEQIAPVAGELVVPKVRPSMFFGTPVAAWLVTNGVRSVVVVGGATSGCVRATVLDAYSLGYSVVLPSDATFDRVDAVRERNLEDLDLKYARVVTTQEVLDRL